MESSIQWVPVARVQGAHGIRGELYIRFRTADSDWWKDRVQLRLVKDQSVPLFYEIEKLRPHKEGAIVQLKALTNRTDAEKLRGYFWEIKKTDLASQPGEKIYLNEVAGFSVVDKVSGDIGKITGFGFNGAQDLLEIRWEQGLYEIPFVDSYIEKIDFENKQILMQLPEGLLNL